MRRIPLLLLCACAAIPTAHAEDREFCANRPGLNTPPCTLAPGAAMVEVGAVGWDHSRGDGVVEDDVTLGDALVRLGIADSAELEFGLTGHVIERTRDVAGRGRSQVSGVGDGIVALRRGLAGPNGPIAVEAFVTLPIASPPIGTGLVGGGVLLPAQFDLPGDFTLAVTPEVDLVGDGDGSGRHLAWGSAAGLSHAIGANLTAAAEIAAFRDDDPDGHSTDARLAGSLAWQLGQRFQLDLEIDAGIAAGAPDRSILFGFAHQFR